MTYRFSFRAYQLPLVNPLRTAHGLWTVREGLILRTEDEGGKVGFGEVAPLPWFGTETLAEATEVCRALGDRFPRSLVAAVAKRFGCVRFGLAMALEPAVTVAETARLPVAALLPAGRSALEALPPKLAAGFLAYKWKVGVSDAADEMGILDDLLAMMPAYTRLRIDANGAWDRRLAQRWLKRCAERPIEFVEQPVAPEDVDTLSGLAREFPVMLALDESIVRLDEAQEWQARGWPGVFVIKPALCGPLSEIGAWIEATKPDVVFSSALETTLGRAVILRFALGGGYSQRAIGFGLGEMFGDRTWDGPVLGPLVDASCWQGQNLEAQWNALN